MGGSRRAHRGDEEGRPLREGESQEKRRAREPRRPCPESPQAKLSLDFTAGSGRALSEVPGRALVCQGMGGEGA